MHRDLKLENILLKVDNQPWERYKNKEIEAKEFF
jgi:serine/threonine protein kinase